MKIQTIVKTTLVMLTMVILAGCATTKATDKKMQDNCSSDGAPVCSM